MNKKCKQCNEVKPITDYYYHSRGKYYSGKCKPCHLKQMYNRPDGVKKMLEYQRKFFQTEEGREYQKQKSIRMYEKHGEKQKARAKLRYQVKIGKIYKPDICDRCGSGGRIEAHHDDYSKPLDVVWLCLICHRIQHGKTKLKGVPAHITKGKE